MEGTEAMSVIRDEHLFRKEPAMPDPAIWPWCYGVAFYASVGLGLLALAWWLGRVR